MTKDQKLLIAFLKRNLPAMAPTFDEGIGIASERFFFAQLVTKIMHQYSIHTVLEAPTDGLMGIPGASSVYFARNGAQVTVSSPLPALLQNAQNFWQQLNLNSKVTLIPDPHFKFPFKKESFDLVWNYCIFERFAPPSLLPTMIRLSRRWVFIVTQNRYNWGYPIHRWYHRKNNQPWDHGYPQLMDLFYLKKLFRRHGLKIVASGYFDTPPWFDTFDMHTRGLGKKLTTQESGWYWSALKPGDLTQLSHSKLIKILDIFQKCLFFPLNFLFAHHFYLLARKD